MEAGLNASLELQCRKTMEIRTKHVRAGFEAGLEDLKAMEIGAKQYDKEGALFWTSKLKKKQARKNGPPQYSTTKCDLNATSSWRVRTVCENKAVAILDQLQEGRPALIQQDGGAMLIAIVLDKALPEAQALVLEE